jgi:hypothetical protein
MAKRSGSGECSRLRSAPLPVQSDLRLVEETRVSCECKLRKRRTLCSAKIAGSVRGERVYTSCDSATPLLLGAERFENGLAVEFGLGGRYEKPGAEVMTRETIEDVVVP